MTPFSLRKGAANSPGISTDVGSIDILAAAADNTLAVMELKRDRGPDSALGQLARYMGWVRAHLAAGAPVRGVAAVPLPVQWRGASAGAGAGYHAPVYRAVSLDLCGELVGRELAPAAGESYL